MHLLPSIFDLKSEAHTLRAIARAEGKSLKHQAALNLVAKKYGFPNWEALEAAVLKQQRSVVPSPFLRNLQRGVVNANWGPELQVKCYWDPSGSWYGKPYPLFEGKVVRNLAKRFPERFSFSGTTVLVQHRPGSFDALAGFGPYNAMPEVAHFEKEVLTLYALPSQDWGAVQANGEAAKLLEQLARDYVARYPAAASRHPEYFPQ